VSTGQSDAKALIELARRRYPALGGETRLPTLLDWVPFLSPAYTRPTWLQPVLDLWERCEAGERVRAVVGTPPRHAKTETLLHCVSHALKGNPRLTIGYISYNDQIAISKSRVALQLAERAGVTLESRALHEWRTHQRGGFLATGMRGTLTGHGVNIAIVDDPVKNRLEAESEAMRKQNWEWFTSTLLTRLEWLGIGKGRGSCIVNMARWHPEDLAGHCINDLGWEYVNLQATAPDNETALWPEKWPLEELLKIKLDVGEYDWASLFQGQPFARGGKVFGAPTAYGETLADLKKRLGSFRYGVGLDFAFTARSSSDYSVLVVMLRGTDGKFYVIDVQRMQVRAPIFTALVEQYMQTYPGAHFRWYAAKGLEAGVADFIQRTEDIQTAGIEVVPAVKDKFSRALRYAAAWNRGDVLVPDDHVKNPWVNRFISEHSTFTGLDDSHDDQVDAAVAAHDVLEIGTDGFDMPPEWDPKQAEDGGQNPYARRW